MIIKMSTTLTDARIAHIWVSNEFIIVRIVNDICFVPQVWWWLPTERVARLAAALSEVATEY